MQKRSSRRIEGGPPGRPAPSSAAPPLAQPLLTRSDLPWLAVAVLTAIGLRILWVAYVNVDPNDGRFDDSVFYHNTAHLLSAGAGYVDPWGGGPTAHWPPAYSAALAVLYKLFGWQLLLAKGLNIAFAAGTVALAYVFARRLFDQRVAYLGALLLAFFPGQIYFSTLVLSETMFAMVFLLVLVLALVWTVQRPEARWWQVLLLGLLVGLAAMVRAEGVFLVAVLVAAWALLVRPWRSVARYAVLAAAGVVLALTPWTVRNAIEFHEFIPLRPDAVLAISDALDPQTDFPGAPLVERRAVDESVTRYASRPWKAAALFGEKVRALYKNDADGIRWTQTPPAPGYTGEYEPPLKAEVATRWSRLANWYFYGAGLAALLGVGLTLLRRSRLSVLLVVIVLGWTALFGFFSPQTRYHFPLGPIISIFAAYFFVVVWDAVVARRWLYQSAAKDGAPPVPADAPGADR